MLLALAPFLAACIPSASSVPSYSDDKSIALPELNLKLDLSFFDSLVRQPLKAQNTCKGEWYGKFGANSVDVLLHVMDVAEYSFAEPEDVADIWRDSWTKTDDKDGGAKGYDLVFDNMRAVPGPFGAAPFLTLLRCDLQKKDDPSSKSTRFLITGLSPDKGWSLRVDVDPPPTKEQSVALQSFLEKCVHYDGKPRDPKWSDAEAQTFWRHMAPEVTFKKYEKPVRTEHFIILSDFPSANQFAKKVEGHYAAAKKVLGFEEQKGRKLLPVLLFRTAEEFQLFYTQKEKLDPKEEVLETGECDDNWYATSFDNDDDWDTLTDVTKQLMINRSRCWGCSKWFCCGVRGYIGSKPPDRAEARGAVKRGKATALDKLIDDRAWTEKRRRKSNKGVAYEIDYWDQSTLWMEFLHESPFAKDKFPQLMQTLGPMSFGNSSKVASALEAVYGVGLTTLQARYTEYFSKK